MEISPFFIYVLPIVTVIAVGALGSTRRLGFWLSVVLSVVLTPVGGFLAAVLSGARKPTRRNKQKPTATKTATAK